jgi:hypothetical protein
MWKLFFDFCYFCSHLIPNRRWRDDFRANKLFDYRHKLDALRRARPDLNFRKMHLAKGGGSIVFIIGKDTFKVRKFKNESGVFKRFEREKAITDALRPYCTIEIPNIQFFTADGFTFYETKRIPGKLLIAIPTWKIKKYQKQISRQLAEFIYKKSFADPESISYFKNRETSSDNAWNHNDMCSNILIDPKTMVITGIIDWEWANYTPIEKEFRGLVRARKKMQKIGLDKTTHNEYEKLVKANIKQ